VSVKPAFVHPVSFQACFADSTAFFPSR
jgi:hypothetical protein